ncbi:hypothetical protein Pelo_1147 [Pelomyxa schiedti]|nr:hypothetical protein Pelo_1147 [Pelomyxa schiedti]
MSGLIRLSRIRRQEKVAETSRGQRPSLVQVPSYYWPTKIPQYSSTWMNSFIKCPLHAMEVLCGFPPQ